LVIVETRRATPHASGTSHPRLSAAVRENSDGERAVRVQVRPVPVDMPARAAGPSTGDRASKAARKPGHHPIVTAGRRTRKFRGCRAHSRSR